MADYGTALVTGASSGIGEAFARALAADGVDLVIVARRTGLLEALARELQERYGVTVEPLTADLADPEQLAVVEDRLRDDERPVDLLVNNAGLGTAGEFWQLPLEDETQQLLVNVLAVMRLTHAALGGMVARGHGGIVNVASVAGFLALPGYATYAGSKAFVARFTESVAEECRGSGVHVTCLAPGFVRTGFAGLNGVNNLPVPGLVWLSPEKVATAAVAAVREGQVYATPGFGYKATELLLGLAPKTLVRRLGGVVFRRT